MKKLIVISFFLSALFFLSACNAKLYTQNQFERRIQQERDTNNQLVANLEQEITDLKNENLNTQNSPKEENKVTKFFVFFHNKTLANDPDMVECGRVFPVERIMPKTEGVAKAALEELFKGPSEEEQNDGYFRSIQADVRIRSISINNGTATVDLTKRIHQGGSCGIEATLTELIKTLTQFPSIQKVKVLVNGVDQTENDTNP